MAKRAMPWRGLAALLVLLGVGGEAGANAPAGRYVLSTETVLDTKTSLVWERQLSPLHFLGADARRYCEDLVLAERDDWRLPSIKELLSLVDFGAVEPAIDTEAFPSTPSSKFWSSTPSHAGPFVAWVLDFRDGTHLLGAIELDPSRVRCVRG